MSTCLLLCSFILIIAGGGCVLNNEDDGAGEVRADTPRAVRVVSPQGGTISQTLDYVGTVEPVRRVKILGRIGATAVEVHADEGQVVAPGEPLLRLESPELDASLRRLTAEVERVRRESRHLCELFEIQRRLADSGVATEASADASESKCDTSRQALAAARAARDEVRQRQAYLEESAPVEGIVLQRFIEAGEYVSPGRPLFEIGSSDLDVRVMVTEGDIAAGIAPGQPVILTTATGAARGRVTRVAPMASGPGRTLEVRIFLPGELARDLRAGMSVDVSFVLDESRDATTLEIEALLESKEGSAVFLVDEGRLRRFEVEVGVRTEDRFEVKTPLPEDQPVVTGDLDGLREGQLVYPVTVGGGR